MPISNGSDRQLPATYCHLKALERCNPWPHVAHRHISTSQLLSLWRHSHYAVSRLRRSQSPFSLWRYSYCDVIRYWAGHAHRYVLNGGRGGKVSVRTYWRTYGHLTEFKLKSFRGRPRSLVEFGFYINRLWDNVSLENTLTCPKLWIISLTVLAHIGVFLSLKFQL